MLELVNQYKEAAQLIEAAQAEQEAKTMLLDFEHQYPGTMKEENVNEILGNLKSNKAAIVQKLKQNERNSD